MSRRTPLTSQTRQLFIVIRVNKDLGKDKVKAYCDENFEQYAFIEHKDDINPNTKLVESLHYHIVGYAKGSRVALSTRLNTIVKFFKLDNSNGIEIEKYNDLCASIQYLLHMNNPEKTPHDISEVIYNYPKEEFELYLNAERSEVVTYDLLYSKILGAKTILDVIKALGLKHYKDNRNVIWDIWKCVRALGRGQDDDTIM